MAEGPGYDRLVQDNQCLYTRPQMHPQYGLQVTPFDPAQMGPGIGFSPQGPYRVLSAVNQWYQQGYVPGPVETGSALPRPMDVRPPTPGR